LVGGGATASSFARTMALAWRRPDQRFPVHSLSVHSAAGGSGSTRPGRAAGGFGRIQGRRGRVESARRCQDSVLGRGNRQGNFGTFESKTLRIFSLHIRRGRPDPLPPAGTSKPAQVIRDILYSQNGKTWPELTRRGARNGWALTAGLLFLEQPESRCRCQGCIVR
jgi:hypothetical protein